MTRSPTAISLLATTILPNSSSRAISNTLIGINFDEDSLSPHWEVFRDIVSFFTAMIYPLWGKIQSSKRFQFFSLRHLDSNQRQFLKSCLSTRWECWGSRPKQTRDCSVLLRLSHAPIHPRFRQESYFLERLFGEREQWQTSVLLLVYWSSVLLGPDY